MKRKHKVYTYLSDEEQEEFEWLQEQRRGSMAAVLREAVMELARRIREGGKS